MINKVQIAAFLKSKRKEKNLKGPEVIQKLKQLHNIDISVKTLYGYENGVSHPDVPTFGALCEIYEVENVLDDVKAQPEVAEKKISVTLREEILVRYFRQASPEAQELVLKMLKPEEKDTVSGKKTG